MKSCLGKDLRVDLSTGIVKSEKIPDEIYDAVLSGKGLAAWYLLKNIPAGADPLGPDNILCFASGALTGTGALLCGRWTVACKSPLTGGWGDANCGGVFSPAIKQCGYSSAAVVLPKRMAGEPPLEKGPLKGVRLRNKEQVSMHWKAFGWNEKTGEPLPETLEELGINRLMEVEP